MPAEYHEPVMRDECLAGLALRPEGTYVDVTFGGGGHARAIVDRLTTGRLYGFDQDADAHANAADFPSDRFTLVTANFRHLRRYLRFHGVTAIDGLLADLGVSSFQINTPERGFSTRFDGPLDMRMDTQADATAAHLLNTSDEATLHRLLGQYGEVRNARTLATALYRARPLHTIADLRAVALPLAPRGRENRYLAQVFQALRIAVNDEMGALRELLGQATDLLRPGGRLVVLSYHSLEDRLVKHYIQHGRFDGEAEKDLYGRVSLPLRGATRKPQMATADEVARNPRARSARLRIAERQPSA